MPPYVPAAAIPIHRLAEFKACGPVPI
jgi:hypothetical protein